MLAHFETCHGFSSHFFLYIPQDYITSLASTPTVIVSQVAKNKALVTKHVNFGLVCDTVHLCFVGTVRTGKPVLLKIYKLSTSLVTEKGKKEEIRFRSQFGLHFIFQAGMFNFRPSVRPVPLEVHISGYPGKHYCPRMATMNKPTFAAICTHSPTKPVLVFVSSRRQTRLTALELISFLAAEDNPKQWLHMPEAEVRMKSKVVAMSYLSVKVISSCVASHATEYHLNEEIVFFF